MCGAAARSLSLLYFVSKVSHVPSITLARHVKDKKLTFPSDPFVVIVLSLSFIASIFFLHIAAKIVRAFTTSA